MHLNLVQNNWKYIIYSHQYLINQSTTPEKHVPFSPHFFLLASGTASNGSGGGGGGLWTYDWYQYYIHVLVNCNFLYNSGPCIPKFQVNLLEIHVYHKPGWLWTSKKYRLVYISYRLSFLRIFSCIFWGNMHTCINIINYYIICLYVFHVFFWNTCTLTFVNFEVVKLSGFSRKRTIKSLIHMFDNKCGCLG